ncbi:putative uncharacterized protein DDB_G0286901 [Sitodiplosis mosellana]|uniref:putative uncharacterized protein DDB_G0286901 n=1 Tax=Sitodiplosis mosellana TaxID=263140 RepID=UPI002444268E|nr:putative uncharacterized protein DDB_G0286901 [Sitodiplosis mosellana]
MIKITHFVNPHKFFFKRLEDEGFDKQLEEMEVKIKGSVNKRMQPPDGPEDIQIGDLVAVLMPDFNKWIRGVIKAKDETGLVYVWAVDYGVPLVSNSTQICKLPAIYAKMNVKFQRVHLGGLVNCVPAESSYDFEKDSVIMREQSNWSMNAIEIAQSVVGRAVHLKFDKVEDVRLPNGSHLFGHLKVQKADGSWNDLTTCLSNALVAKVTNDTWATHAHRLDTINQKEWLTMNGSPLQAMIVVSPTSAEKIANELKLQNKDQAKCQPNKNKPRIEEDQQVATGQANENIENQHLDMKAGNTRNFSRKHSLSVAASTRGGGRGGLNFHGSGRPNNRVNNYRQRDDDYSSQFPKGWHTNGLLNNQKYREEIEFFESSFIPPINSTSSEKADDESKDTNTNENGPVEKVTPNVATANAQQPKKDDTDIKLSVNGNDNNNDGGGGNSQVNTAKPQNLNEKTEQSTNSINASQTTNKSE